MVMLWRGCGRHLTAAQKKYTGNSFKFGKVCGGYLCLLFLLSLSLSLSSLSYMLFGAYTFSLNTLNSLSTFPYLSRNVQGELEK